MRLLRPVRGDISPRSSAFLALCVALSLALTGCVYRGAKITEGTDLAIGLTVPGTEGVLQFNALNYLSGFRLGVAENAALTVEYSTVATNSYFGVVQTETAKRIKAKVEPCETSAEGGVPSAEEEESSEGGVRSAELISDSLTPHSELLTPH